MKQPKYQYTTTAAGPAGGMPPPQGRRRKPGSFTLKLTLGQGMRMFWMLLAVNILVVFLYGVMLVTDMEREATEVSRMTNTEAMEYSGQMHNLEIVASDEPGPGLWLDVRIDRHLQSVQGARRWFAFVPEEGHHFLGDWQVRPLYTVNIPAEDGGYLHLTFDLTGQLRRFAYGMTILAAAEFLLWLTNLASIRRAVRKTLAPIQQLAATAQSISVEPTVAPRRPVPEPAQEELELAGTIDTLNRITAKKLDTRIAIDDERVELRDLASAINGMLDRLDAAYSSQLRFVSDASHELRTPIAVIQGYANLLDRWGKEDPAVLQESIDAIKGEAEGMKALVEQLLFLARSDNNSIVLDLKPLNISEVAAEMLRNTQIIDQEHQFSSDIAPELYVQGDGTLLKQALRIFMENAVKYTPGGEGIKVSATQADGWVRVSVTDNGIGIPEKDIPHVFERFFRSDESRARATGGTGLGLAIAKWTIQRHGGNVEILSRQDIGTRLTMVLPVTKAPALDAEQGEAG